MKFFFATKAFVVHNGRVLILREASTNPDGTNTGRYDVPGGRLTPGERFDQSLQREIREETGLKVIVGQPFYVGEWRPVVRGEQWQIVGVYFLCETKTDVVRLSKEHDSFEWINPAEYHRFNVIDNVRPAFEAFLTRT